MVNHQTIAEAVLGCTIEPGGYCPCPGAHRHTTATGRRDFRIVFDPEGRKMPSGHCFHGSCEPERREAMVAIIRAIRAAEKAEATGNPAAAAPYRSHSPKISRPEPPARPQLDQELAHRLAEDYPATAPAPTRDWLRSISPITIPADPTRWAELLLDTLYNHRERILIFTEFKSQGQYLRVIKEGNYRLAAHPGTRATRTGNLPTRAHDGAWYLAAPVLGTWQPNENNRTADGTARPGRRHAACCTRFPYAVIESDTMPEPTWLRCLAQLHDPIAAIYTSGGKSLHALIKVDAETPADFNRARAALLARLVPIGADPAAITAVRLTRLPGVIRLSKGESAMQELLYLNPHATTGTPLCTMPIRREVKN